jgi:hypothetical protein
VTNPGFLLAEDAAIKRRLSNISVSDDREATRVAKVFFRYPETETERDYPFITIEHVGMSHDRSRQHSEQTYYFSTAASASAAGASLSPCFIDYYPSELNTAGMIAEKGNSNYLRTDSFVPLTLMYQISTYARSALHDRQLTAKILRRVIPFRRGFIEIPEDGTIRRFELTGWGNSDLLDGEAAYRKRIFRKVYTIQMSAEMPASDLEALKQVTSVIGNITNADNGNPTVFTTSFSEEF